MADFAEIGVLKILVKSAMWLKSSKLRFKAL